MGVLYVPELVLQGRALNAQWCLTGRTRSLEFRTFMVFEADVSEASCSVSRHAKGPRFKRRTDK